VTYVCYTFMSLVWFLRHRNLGGGKVLSGTQEAVQEFATGGVCLWPALVVSHEVSCAFVLVVAG
jgi:hypothetical protein